MTDPAFLTALTAFIVENAPAWFASLGGTILEKSRDAAFEEGKEILIAKGERLKRRIFRLDEKEQVRHLEVALKNATERGLAAYHTPQERDLYCEIIQTLSQPGPSGEQLRHEILQLFTLSEEPDLATLTDIYNKHQRTHDPACQSIDASPYLSNFFAALIGELYADPYFRAQLRDTLPLRAARKMQLSLLEIVSTLQQIGQRLEGNYTADEFARDIKAYTDHIAQTLHRLKIVGIVPRDQSVDPELNGIFVPLRIALRRFNSVEDEFNLVELVNQLPKLQRKAVLASLEEAVEANAGEDSLVAILEHSPFLVLLGGPGSGKSTATKYLAWSHVAANPSSQSPLLSGNPLPLRIELRLLSEERKRANYDFLSFATEVLLKREGVEIHTQMFKELLTRRSMLLIFDGLDEVGTLEERLGLVNEIEHFALRYPGNRVLVTSRPVGYDLARFSHPLFSHADVQPFNDAQIQQFLTNWYTSVLRLSPIPHREREEMDVLLKALEENSRLHKLAENPLLLTVITALHRYERLPDRRVQVYDRCADLLLETWAKLKGTHIRWQGMKMIKEEQYACIAYLGFLLHEKSQENTEQGEDQQAENQTVDVNARFLRKKVEDFLEQRKLITELTERQAEAKRFIDLVQTEAGLIVERGTDENGESLYSFVHRTFQEYFAAADIYERYQQEEDPTIIRDFLREHLHDPHWREVIMLLLGKLKSKPVTNQLQHILQGKIKSKRSGYTQFVQQDLFFVCDCLVEEIKVEHTLVEMVISRLKEVVQSSWSPVQRWEALDFLGKLMRTRQYGEQAKQELLFFATTEGVLDEAGRLAAIQALYLHSAVHSEAWVLAHHILTDLVKRPDLSVEQMRRTAESLYFSSPEGSEAQRQATELLLALVKRPDLSVEQMRETAESLYRSSPEGSEARQQATELLLELVKRPDLSVEQMRETARSLYLRSPEGSEAQRQARELLLALVKRSDLSVAQTWRTAESLYFRSPEGSEAQQQATGLLLDLVERPDLSVEQICQTAESLYFSSPEWSGAGQLATTLLLKQLSRSGQADNSRDIYPLLRSMVPQFHKLQ
jgi:hypothetical protein